MGKLLWRKGMILCDAILASHKVMGNLLKTGIKFNANNLKMIQGTFEIILI